MNNFKLAATGGMLAVLTIISSAAQAVLIDFNGLAGINYTAGPLVPVDVIDDEFQSDGVLFGLAGVSAGVGIFNNQGPDGSQSAGGLDAAGIFPGTGSGCCTGDIHFSFIGTTDFVSFDIGNGGGDTDIFTINAYDIFDNLISTQVVSGASYADIGTVSINAAGIQRVWADFDDTNIFGFGFDNLEFNAPTSVPEPATLALIGLGLAGIGFARKKKIAA